MKRILSIIALSALISSIAPIQAGFSDSVRAYGIKAVQGLKKYPYVTAASGVAALCAASIACNQYAKSIARQLAFAEHASQEFVITHMDNAKFEPEYLAQLKQLPNGVELDKAIEHYNQLPCAQRRPRINRAFAACESQLKQTTMASRLGFFGKALDVVRAKIAALRSK